MESKTKTKLTLFAENWQVIRKQFTWQNALTKRLVALLYAQENKPIDIETIRQCHTLIKQNTGAFSTFRGNMALCVATLLSLSPNPQGLFDKTLKVYDLLKAAKLRASDYLVVAAYQIASQTESYDYQKVVNRTREFYDGMKARNFFTTGQDDTIFAAMLGLTDLDVTAGTERVAQLIDRLKGEFWSKNSVQTLSQVLTLGNSCDETARRVLSLRDKLRSQKIKLDKTYTLPALGVLALMPVECDVIVRDIAEAQQVLRAQKGFGSLSVTMQELLVFAAAVVAGEYADKIKCGVITATLSTSIANIIIAQQVAMIAAVSASSAAAAAASS
jgi:hypothetical protein